MLRVKFGAMVWCCALVAMTPLLIQCGDQGSEEEPTIAPDAAVEPELSMERIVDRTFDGSDDVRLAYSVRGGGPLDESGMLISEVGFSYLYMNGKGQYWVFESAGWLGEARVGQLNRAQLTQLATDLHLGRWRALEGYYFENVNDASSTLLYDAGHRIECTASCDSQEVQAEVHVVSEATRQVVSSLYEQASPMDGPLRVIAYAHGPAGGQGSNDSEWPTWPLDAIADEAMIEGADAAMLREFRRVTLIDRPFATSMGFVKDATVYSVSMRDALPFESANHTVALP